VDKPAKFLVPIIESDEDFESRMGAYVKAGGEVPKNFLEILDKARTILQSVEKQGISASISELPSIFQEAFVQMLTEKGKIKALAELLQKTKDKSIKRTIKRAMHALRQKGVVIPELEPNKRAPRQIAQETQRLPSIITLPLADGSQEIFLVTKAAREFSVLSAVVYYGEGIRDFGTFSSNKSGIAGLKSKLTELGRASVEIPYEQAHAFLERSLKWHDEKNTVPPQGFLSEFRRWEKPKTIEQMSQAQEAINWQDVISQSAELLNQNPFDRWTMSWEEERRFELKINEIYTSQIIVEDAKRFELIKEQIDKTADEFFGARREFFAAILKEASALLQIDNKPELAKLANAIASSLTESNLPPSRIPFFRGILSRRLLVKTPAGTKSFEEMEKEKLIQADDKSKATPKGSGGLIITG